MKRIILSILILCSIAASSQTKDHYGKYRFDSLYSTLAQKGIDTTNFKIVVERETDGKHFKMYWPVSGSSGITSLGVSGSGQTGATQTLAPGTSGTDFNIVSATNTHTFNIPTFSATARGLVTNSGTSNTTDFLRRDGSWAVPSGVTVLKNYVTQTTSTGGGTTDNITIATLPANTLTTNGDALIIEFAYTTTGSDTKNTNVTFGGSGSLVATGASTTAGYYVQRIKMLRTSSTTVMWHAESWQTFSMIGIGNTTVSALDFTVSNAIVAQITSGTAASITINYVTVRVEKE
jgi:hypothetical protein